MKRKVIKGDILSIKKWFNDLLTEEDTVTVVEVKKDALTIVVNDCEYKESFDMPMEDIEEYFEIFTKGYEVQKFIRDRIDENGRIVENKDDVNDIYDLIEATNNTFGSNIKIKLLAVAEEDEIYAWAGIVDSELYLDGNREECKY